jgi:hypothetical protein
VFEAVVAAPLAESDAVGVDTTGGRDEEEDGEDIPRVREECCDAGTVGAETPAMAEPSPSFWRLSASSLPVASRPFADWNLCIAEIVSGSHFEVGSP